MSPSLHPYRVLLTSWNSLEVVVNAINEHHAMAVAERLWTIDEAAFTSHDGGIDAVDATCLEPEAVK